MPPSLKMLVCWLAATLGPLGLHRVASADELFTRTEDVIYRRKHGTALTLDVFAPRENANRAALVLIVSGSWRSSHDNIRPQFVTEYVRRGYTVFAVVHGSSPRFSLPEILDDVHRAVRFVRGRAEAYNFDGDRIGVTGASAGGHLALMLGTAGTAGDPDAKDPVERVSSRVQAVACFFPPTDLLNYGVSGFTILGMRAPFDFQEYDDQTQTFVTITDRQRRLQIGREVSPVYHVTADDPPTLIIHGDADRLVPLQQSRLMIDKLREANVPCELVIKEGGAHGWPDIAADVPKLADWFDKHLAKHAEPDSARAVREPRFLAQWGSEGSEPGEFHFPIGIAINAADEIFVSDFYNDRVQKFSTEGKLLGVIPVSPTPGGIAIGNSGEIYLSHFAEKKREERTTDRISVYDSTGKLLREWGRTGSEDGEFDCPGGMAISRDGRVYVADQTNRRVQVFDPQGKLLFKWGEYGTKEGQFGGNVSIRSRVGGPQFLAFDRQGNVYTTEGSVGRVQTFTAEGRFLRAWGNNEDKPGGFGGVFTGFKDRKATLQGPVSICLDRHDRIWVSAVSGRIQQFTNEGTYLRGFGTSGTEPGQFYAPHGLAFDSRGHLYIVDAFNHRVQKFAVE
jgi:acetyl esterase/lipase/DNA-binding beta-propeller fold protein YncE